MTRTLFTIAGAIGALPATVSLAGGLPVTTESATITPPAAPGSADSFGRALALDGDTLYVGSPEQGTKGSVFVYDVSDFGAPALVHTIEPDPGDDLLRFGYDLALDGDTLVISAPGSATVEGAALVYRVDSQTQFTELFEITNDTPLAGENFGESVDIGAGVIAVSSPDSEGFAPQDGAFDRMGLVHLHSAVDGSRFSKFRPHRYDAQGTGYGNNLYGRFGLEVLIDGDMLYVRDDITDCSGHGCVNQFPLYDHTYAFMIDNPATPVGGSYHVWSLGNHQNATSTLAVSDGLVYVSISYVDWETDPGGHIHQTEYLTDNQDGLSTNYDSEFYLANSGLSYGQEIYSAIPNSPNSTYGRSIASAGRFLLAAGTTPERRGYVDVIDLRESASPVREARLEVSTPLPSFASFSRAMAAQSVGADGLEVAIADGRSRSNHASSVVLFEYGVACEADFNQDDETNIFDVLDFITAWNAGLDYNDDGAVNILDVTDFIQTWNNGCA